jgi:hypothetical protein
MTYVRESFVGHGEESFNAKGQTPGGADPWSARDALVPLLANGTSLLQSA